ncbi:MAG: Gfo/Idh/MocA family oxidoreductase [Nitrospirae bacterium]|nr:Gfo/Idh/MocA family oxidoreductase [Nitrospirota bacterium]
MLKVGVIGYGYWGPNIVRNFNRLKSAKVVEVADTNNKALNRVSEIYPAINVTTSADEIITSADTDVIAIVTPVSTHFELAKKALQNGKHIFVEKPFTTTSAQAEELIELADKKNLLIMVDHTFLFTGAVKKIKQLIDDNSLGRLYYYDSMRINLGLFQHDVNVIWDLAVHDLSIMDYLMKEKPVAIGATGKGHVNDREDIAYITVQFSNNVISHFNVNWLSPVKIRMTLIGGEKKMLVWNDLSADEKIRIYDKGIEVSNREGIYDMLVSYRTGDMWAPKVEQLEALQLETEYFVNCVKSGDRPFNDGQAGLRIVKMLEACDRSLKKNGELVSL